MDAIQIAERVDARGLQCPMPIVRAAQAIARMRPGTVLELLATDPGSTKDIPAWCRSTGHALLDSATDGTVQRFLVRRK